MVEAAAKTAGRRARAAAKFFDGAAQGGVLSGHIDRYNGIKIEDSLITAGTTPAQFREQLVRSIAVYKEKGIRGVWLKLTKDKAHLAGVAVQDGGFAFHHAKEDYLMMTNWLSTDPNKMPGFASHYVGVGGLVLNKSRNRILCIQEKKPPTELGRLWKLPGGLVESGESIAEAAIREVWEETGIRTRFVSILGFRELMKYQWGQQDLYFVCMLEPEDEAQPINIQMPDEIHAADWITFEQMRHFKFTTMATNVCRLLHNLDHINSKQIDLSQMPVGDVFRDVSFSEEEYTLLGNKNRFYSSDYLKRVGAYIKETRAKL